MSIAWGTEQNQSDIGGSSYRSISGPWQCDKQSRSPLLAEEVSFVSAEHHIRSTTDQHLREMLLTCTNTVRTTAYILKCKLHKTCPHSVSQNGTCGGADGPDEKGRWHLKHVTNSQISRSVDEEDEIWDMPWGYGKQVANNGTGTPYFIT